MQDGVNSMGSWIQKTASLGGFALTVANANAAALSTPSMSGPLSANPNPISLDAGPLGTIYVDGALSGLGFWQDTHVPGDQEWRADLSNGQVFVQKTDGWLQFYVQAGGYSLPSLGTSYLNVSDTMSDTFGAVPVAYAKIVPTDNFSVEAGKLPTLIGDEYTFTFENMDIERGLLWNQEPAISRGVQANYSSGPFSLALSWNDGFYSNRLNWISGSAAYVIDSSDTISFIAGGNTGHTGYSSFITPLAQNNGDIFNLIYTWTSGPWTVSPYIQYANVPADADLGIARNASTTGGAVLVSYGFNDEWKIAGRAEYISSSGDAAAGAPNLLYGPGSDAWSFTVTPTYQHGIFFARGEASWVGAGGTTPGFAFGENLDKTAQARLLLEAGVLF